MRNSNILGSVILGFMCIHNGVNKGFYAYLKDNLLIIRFGIFHHSKMLQYKFTTNLGMKTCLVNVLKVNL